MHMLKTLYSGHLWGSARAVIGRGGIYYSSVFFKVKINIKYLEHTITFEKKITSLVEDDPDKMY